VESVDELLDGLLLLGGAAQLQKQVVHGAVIVDFAAIVFRAGLRMSVAIQRNHIAFINISGNAWSRVPAHVHGLRMCNLDREDQ
jgi:hypothetical protein